MKKRTFSHAPKKPTPPVPPERKVDGCRNPVRNHLKQYCKNCPNIEPLMDTATLCGNGEVEISEIIITCKHLDQCQRLIDYLKGVSNEQA